MSDIKDKLKNLLAKQGVMTGAQWQAKQQEKVQRRAEGELEVDKLVPGEVVGDPDDCFYRVQEDFPLDNCQGEVPLGAALDVLPEHVAMAACDDELEAFDPATTVFIDTETTGLAGGTGTVAFLVGVGYFIDGAFRLEQCFMRDYDEEEPMLRHLDALFQRCETIVTYNGKSFDVPLLRTRFISNRIRSRLDGAMHFDLVHAARRFWKRRLGDCSLGNVERHILGLQRHGDVPGSEIPQIWFDYLRSRDATVLKKVFYHHKMDILSLVSLTAVVSQCLAEGENTQIKHAEDKLSLVRLHFKEKRFADVVTHANQLLETEPSALLQRECLELLAYAYKRLGQYQPMEETWTLYLQQHPKSLEARLELAKHYEHRKRDLLAAQHICEETLQFLDTRAALGRDADLADAPAENFKYRLARIQKKLQK